MLLGSGFFDLVQAFIRVPPLFVIDEILRFDSKLSSFEEDSGIFWNGTIESLHPETSRFILVCGIRLGLSALGCLLAMCIFALNTKDLMVLFLHIVSVASVLLSYWGNATTLKFILKSESNINALQSNLPEILNQQELLRELLANLTIQTVMAFLFIKTHFGVRHSSVKKFLPFSFFLPTVMCFFPVSSSILLYTPLCSSFFPVIATRCTSGAFIRSAYSSFRLTYNRAKRFAYNFGISALVEHHWLRLHLSMVLKIFCVLRILEHSVAFYIAGSSSSSIDLVKYLLTNSCDTFTAVLGLTSLVSYLCNVFGHAFHSVLQMEYHNEFGTASAIFFYVLALQNHLSGLDPEERLVGVCRNLCLLFATLLHFAHNVLSSTMVNLSASHNPSKKKHATVLSISALLVLVSSAMLYVLWTTQQTSSWLLVVTIFCAALLQKVVITLTKYAAYLYDALRETFWEKQDDFVFNAELLGNVLEIVFHVLLFGIGVYTVFFERAGLVHIGVLAVHVYFNLWGYASATWADYSKRRAALKKIEVLPDATWKQLDELNDVCAICYQDMESAKVTRCNHLFHGVCLRKWLNVRDRCPLCHEVPIYLV